MLEEVEGFITICKLPEGEAPQWVRREWIGLTLPVIAICYTEGYGLLSENKYGPRIMHIVPQDQALRILSMKSKEASDWWRAHGFPHEKQTFGFNLDEAQILGTLKCKKPENLKQFFGLLEVGVGAHDHPANN